MDECVICGDEFMQPDGYRRKRQICSDECWKERHRIHMKDRVVGVDPSKAVDNGKGYCRICGKKTVNYFYCSKCWGGIEVFANSELAEGGL